LGRAALCVKLAAMSSAVASLTLPDAQGHFGPFGGRYVPETLMHPLQELEAEYRRANRNGGGNGSG